jgi:hypothetical protein
VIVGVAVVVTVSVAVAVVVGTVSVAVAVDVAVCVAVAVSVGVWVSVGVMVGVAVVVAVAVSVGVMVGVAVVVAVAVSVGVMVGVGVVVIGGVVGVVTHAGVVTTLVSSETWPLRARARPSTRALVSIVIDVRARMVPLKLEAVPSVAELPTCQNTLHACAPLVRMTLLEDAVIRVDATWKINTEAGLP